MKKLFTILVAFVATFTLYSCGEDDFYEPYPPQDWSFNDNKLSNQLSQTEKNLVGSYVSDDGKEPVIYLTLSDNRTGSYTSNGQTSTFSWYVDGSDLCMRYSDNEGEYYTITYDSNNRLCLNGIPFVANNGGSDGQYADNMIVGQWQGKLGDAFYKDVYGFSDTSELGTIFEFAADGTGAQLDYNETTPTTDYSANTFTWVPNGNTISISYYDNDNGWTSANIDGPSITSAKFTGSISYTNFAVYKLSFISVKGFDWTPYLGYTSGAKLTRAADGTALSRMLQLRLQGKQAVSSGSFKK